LRSLKKRLATCKKSKKSEGVMSMLLVFLVAGMLLLEVNAAPCNATAQETTTGSGLQISHGSNAYGWIYDMEVTTEHIYLSMMYG